MLAVASIMSIFGDGDASPGKKLGMAKVESARITLPADRKRGFDACVKAVTAKAERLREWLRVSANPLLGGGPRSNGVRVDGQILDRGRRFSFECKYWSGKVQDLSWVQTR